MPRVVFTSNLKRHLACSEAVAEGQTVREVLDAVFAEQQQLQGYVFDDQARLRRHMNVFVDNQPIKDRKGLSDPVNENSEIYVMQALSGG